MSHIYLQDVAQKNPHSSFGDLLIIIVRVILLVIILVHQDYLNWTVLFVCALISIVLGSLAPTIAREPIGII